jgi:hypothetical protein|tara:strand:+ start:545 stop:901 length:357 start_codon:yes stop_codon:yes gene_type:complete
MDKQKNILYAEGLLCIKSDEMEVEVQFESDHIYLNLIRLNFKNVSPFFKLIDFRKTIDNISNKLLFWKLDLILSWKGSELILIGKNANPNRMQKIILSENVEVKNFRNFVKLFRGKSK